MHTLLKLIKNLEVKMMLRTITMAAFFLGTGTFAILPASHHSCHSQEVEVTPLEDLMSEHGALNRVMLIYEEIIRRVDQNQSFSPLLLKQTAGVIRDLIENHHEKLEEKYIFPMLEKAGVLVEEVKILRKQHAQGRVLTKYILTHASKQKLQTKHQRQAMRQVLQEFITMYRPHEAREDTVIFPTFLSLLTEEEYKELGELFEEEEHRHFGKDPLDDFVKILADVEKQLGIYDLKQFSPK